MKTVYFIALLFPVVFGCTTTSIDREPISLFKNNTVEIVGGDIVIDSRVLKNPQKLLFYDSLLITVDHGGSYCLNIYNLNGKHLFDVIKRGKGPNELLIPFDVSIDQNKKILFVYDFMLNKLFKYKMDSILLTKRAIPVDNIEFDSRFFKVIENNYGNFIGIGPLDGGRYFVENRNKELLGYFLDYPNDENHKNEKQSMKAMAYQGNLRNHPVLNKFVFASGDAGVIEICEYNNNNIYNHKSLYHHLPEYVPFSEGEGFGAQFTKKNRFGYLDIYCTNKLIYVLYSGRHPQKAQNKQNFLRGNNILVFDWDGKPIKAFRFDEEIMAFTIGSNNTIYILSISPEPQIKKYEISI